MKPLLCSSRGCSISLKHFDWFPTLSGFLGSETYPKKTLSDDIYPLLNPIHSCDLRAIKHISLSLKRDRLAWDVEITKRKFVNQDT